MEASVGSEMNRNRTTRCVSRESESLSSTEARGETHERDKIMLSEMDSAMALLPNAKKVAYMEASKRCPNIIQVESSPIRFLRYEGYDPWAAACRLASYWEIRKEVFGQRAFLPMNLSGEGALVQEDAAVFKYGGIALLPNDQRNRAVLYGDRSKSAVFSERAVFFLAQQLSMNHKSQIEPAVALIVLNHALGANFNRRCTTLLSRLFQKGLPMKPPVNHLVVIPPQQGCGSFTEKIIPLALKRMGSFQTKSMIIHVVYSEEEALEKLREHGFAREGLPASLGGTLGSDYFLNWQRQHGSAVREIEDLTGLVQDALENFSATKGRIATFPVPMTAQQKHSEQDLDNHVNLSSAPKRQRSVAQKGDSKLHLATKRSRYLSSKTQGHNSSAAEAIIRDSFSSQEVVKEKAEILQDLFGTGEVSWASPCGQDSGQDSACLAQLDEALAIIPDSEKAAFLEARERVPALVELESKPIWFLQHEAFNPWAAAKRLANYWKERNSMFGDRAFLPMQLSGALSKEDVAVFRTGVLRLMPCDQNGRCIMYYEPGRLTQPSLLGLENRQRLFFYLGNVLLRMKAVRKRGFVFLKLMDDGTPVVSGEQAMILRVVNLVRDSFPITERAVHMVCLTQNPTFTEFIVPAVVRVLKTFKFLGDRTLVHMGSNSEELLAELAKYGLTLCCLPEALGGSCGDEEFMQWFADRNQIEAGLLSLLANTGAEGKPEKLSFGEPSLNVERRDDSTNGKDSNPSCFKSRPIDEPTRTPT